MWLRLMRWGSTELRPGGRARRVWPGWPGRPRCPASCGGSGEAGDNDVRVREGGGGLGMIGVRCPGAGCREGPGRGVILWPVSSLQHLNNVKMIRCCEQIIPQNIFNDIQQALKMFLWAAQTKKAQTQKTIVVYLSELYCYCSGEFIVKLRSRSMSWSISSHLN